MNQSALILLAAIFVGSVLPDSAGGVPLPSQAEAAIAVDPVVLVRRAAANELHAIDDRVAQGPAPVRFLLYKEDEKGSDQQAGCTNARWQRGSPCCYQR